ncbi:hypothetical protein [Mesorhizobium koreense]|uniref:hypothetical protein n=1 Tax=Mesorhizobium koreense TaxID=3074855 RepID=UPI00287BA003|nr:hypothetical protein [Mesorhizobium sp. WR6]
MAEADLSLVADSVVSIGGVFTGDPTSSAAFTALTFVPVAGLTDIGEFGDEAEIATLKTIDGARVRKKVGSKDAGTLEITVGRDPADPGQVALRAAIGSKDAYALKIEQNDAPAGGTNTIHYLKVYVASAKNKLGGPDDFVTTVFTLAVDAAPLTIEAAEA